MNEKKILDWKVLALMTVTIVWGFTNTVIGYANHGLRIIFCWFVIFSIYFIPYVLMVGEMGATFKEHSGGVCYWLKATGCHKLAYYAGWTQWAVHIPYLAQRPQGIIISTSWLINGNNSFTKTIPVHYVQLIGIVIFLFFMWYASRGVTALKRLGAIAGSSMFVMTMLYVVLTLSAPFFTKAKTFSYHFDLATFLPNLDLHLLVTLALMIFAVGGCEKLAPYVNNLAKPAKEFPRAMIAMVVLVVLNAMLGTLAMGLMFDPNNIPKDLMMNGTFYCFQRLGHYYGVGNLFLTLYSLAQLFSQMAVLAICIDAPTKIMLADVDPSMVPKALRNINEKGVPVGGYILTGTLSILLMLIPLLGIGDLNSLFNYLVRLNAIVHPISYLFIFYAYIAIKKGNFSSDYIFVNNRSIGKLFGYWCLFLTTFACLMGMLPQDIATFSSGWWFQFTVNIATPFFLLVLGMILPFLASREQAAHS